MKERQRLAFLMRITDPVWYDEYLKRHEEIWPEMLQALRGAGIHNYSIYRHEQQLFAYLECDDVASMVQRLNDDPVNARWQEWMKPLIEVAQDPATGFAPLLPEMFHMD